MGQLVHNGRLYYTAPHRDIVIWLFCIVRQYIEFKHIMLFFFFLSFLIHSNQSHTIISNATKQRRQVWTQRITHHNLVVDLNDFISSQDVYIDIRRILQTQARGLTRPFYFGKIREAHLTVEAIRFASEVIESRFVEGPQNLTVTLDNP